MAASNVAIVYSVAQSRRRRLIVPDSDQELPPRTMTGEAILLVPMTTYIGKGFDPDVFLAQKLGKPALNDRCGFCDGTNTVVGVWAADPAIDTLRNLTARAHPLVAAGDVWNGTTFTRRYAVYDTVTKIVTQVTMLNIDDPVVALGGTSAIVASPVLQVGQPVPANLIGVATASVTP